MECSHTIMYSITLSVSLSIFDIFSVQETVMLEDHQLMKISCRHPHLITVLNRHPRYCYCWFSFTEEEKYPGGFDFHLTLFYMFTKYVHVLYTSSPRLEIELTLPWSPPPQSSFPYTINLVMFKSSQLTSGVRLWKKSPTNTTQEVRKRKELGRIRFL